MTIVRGSIAATLIAASFLFLGQAGATTLTTVSTTTWRSASFITGSYGVVDFYPVQQMFYNTAAGITLTPTGSTTSINVTGLDNGSYYLAGDSSQKALLSSTDAGAFLKIALPTGGESAFLVGTTASAAHPLTLTLSDGESFSVASPVFGVSVSHSISWATLGAAPGSQALLNDFWYAASALPQDAAGGGAPTPTPEPATILMTCAGALLLILGSVKAKSAAEPIA